MTKKVIMTTQTHMYAHTHIHTYTHTRTRARTHTHRCMQAFKVLRTPARTNTPIDACLSDAGGLQHTDEVVLPYKLKVLILV